MIILCVGNSIRVNTTAVEVKPRPKADLVARSLSRKKAVWKIP